MPRFTTSTPPHFANPAIIDWQVFDEGQRISPEKLAIIANTLQRRVEELEKAAHDAASVAANFFALVSA